MLVSKEANDRLFDKMLDKRVALPIERKEDGWWLMAVPVRINGKWHEISCMSRYETKLGFGYKFVLDRYTEQIDLALSFTINKDNAFFSYNEFSVTFKNDLVKLHTVIDELEAKYGSEREVDLDKPVIVKLN